MILFHIPYYSAFSTISCGVSLQEPISNPKDIHTAPNDSNRNCTTSGCWAGSPDGLSQRYDEATVEEDVQLKNDDDEMMMV